MRNILGSSPKWPSRLTIPGMNVPRPKRANEVHRQPGIGVDSHSSGNGRVRPGAGRVWQFARGPLPSILRPKPRPDFALAAGRPCRIAGAGRGGTRRQLLAGGLRGAGRTRANASWSRAVSARAAGRPAAAQHVAVVAGGGVCRQGGGWS